MSKRSIVFIVVACIALVSAMMVFMKRSAHRARERSDQVMEEFKTVDRDLKQTNIRIDSANKILFDSLNSKLK